jgi:hypothetical protein
MLVNDRRFFIYNFGRDAAEDKTAKNRDFKRDAAGDEASEDEVDRATVNYNIPSPPVEQSRSSFANDSRVY